MNIIFLDIDGVLNSLPYFKSMKDTDETYKKDIDETYNEISDFHLKKLAEIYHTCNAEIVLSSTWRDLDDPSDKVCYQTYEYLLKSLAKYDMKIISKTPTIHMNRPLEIITWVNNQIDKEDINFVSLDDDFSVEDYAKYGIEDKLIHTKFFCSDISEGGLQQEHVDRAIKILMN